MLLNTSKHTHFIAGRKTRQWLHAIILIGSITFIITSCEKFVAIDPPDNRITEQNVFTNELTASAVLTGMYSRMLPHGSNIAKYTGLSADESDLWSDADIALQDYYKNALVSNQGRTSGNETWSEYYNFIFTCNSAIESLGKNTTLTESFKKQLLGESHFLRAWFYFYLVNLYGDLPIPLGTDPQINYLLTRSPVEKVFAQIEVDLLEAQKLLHAQYLTAQLKPYPVMSMERVRPTKWAATALLARVYLYLRQFQKAELEASKLIDYKEYFQLVPLNDVFLKNSREAIWQFQPIEIGWNTNEARMFDLSAIPSGFSSSKPLHISTSLINAFEQGDERLSKWVGIYTSNGDSFYFPHKYKAATQNSTITSTFQITEYSMALRLGEQYLIRAEARANLGQLNSAIADLDVIRHRATLPLVHDTNPSISQNDLLDLIIHERRIELFSEWGHRWFDLKRINKIDPVMIVETPKKGGAWETTDKLYPIPYEDLLNGINLIQNNGY